jgi:lipoprotein NlpI
MRVLNSICIIALSVAQMSVLAEEPVGAWTERDQAELLDTQSKRVKELTVRIEEIPKSVDLYSKRGDAYFFLGEFEKSVADYEKMVQLDESLDAGHWRRGIADFYAKKYEAAAKQFELYHSFDDVDRENGIWRYLSQVKAYGRDKAREGLLKYKKDDREPFPSVYQLFAGKLTPDEILKQIGDAKIDDDERQKRLFYAELYIGLNHDVEKEPQKASEHLQAATAIKWPRTAGYGPNYMWHVGRVHAIQLREQSKKKPQ